MAFCGEQRAGALAGRERSAIGDWRCVVRRERPSIVLESDGPDPHLQRPSGWIRIRKREDGGSTQQHRGGVALVDLGEHCVPRSHCSQPQRGRVALLDLGGGPGNNYERVRLPSRGSHLGNFNYVDNFKYVDDFVGSDQSGWQFVHRDGAVASIKRVSALEIALVGVGILVVVAEVFFGRHLSRGSQATVIIGDALLIGGFVIGLVVLPQRDAPSPLPDAVGVLAPPPVLPAPGRGFAVGLATQVNGCSNPVTVTLVAAGTGEYWSDYRNESARRAGYFPFMLVLPDDVKEVLDVGLASPQTAVTNPISATVGFRNKIHVDPPQYGPNRSLVTGTVTDWPSTLLSLIVRFQANWIAPRGVSSCYLDLPSVSGQRTASAVVAAAGGCKPINITYPSHPCHPKTTAGGIPYVGPLIVTHGTSIVTVASGDVSPELSLPPPQSLIDGKPAWTCAGRPDVVRRSFPKHAGTAVPDAVSGDGGAAYSILAITGTAGSYCRAVVVITENSAAYARDLWILAIGTLITLGITLLVETAVDAVARHGGAKSTQTDKTERTATQTVKPEPPAVQPNTAQPTPTPSEPDQSETPA